MVRTTSNEQQPDGRLQTKTLDLRFTDGSLVPLGDWHPAIVYHQETSFDVEVDQRGKALVLALLYPPSFGGPPPFSSWTFSARWLDVDGPLTGPFDPVVPLFTRSSDGQVFFPGWGAFLPVIEGGFAMYQYQSSPRYGGTISPVGWYAYYPSGEATSQSPPDWLSLYDGSVQPLDNGRGYGAVTQDPSTCDRTALLVAPSGRTCYTLPLGDNNNCGIYPAISPDGTLLLQTGCSARWWPGLLGAATRASHKR